MSEPVVKQRPTIDLDDFERRMRHGSPPSREDDPLAELARLVGEPYDPFGDVFAREAAAPHGSQDSRGRREPGFSDGDQVPRLLGDFASIEAGLRGGYAPNAGAPTDQFGHPAYGEHALSEHAHGEPNADPYAQMPFGQDWADQARYAPQQQAKSSKRPLYVMAATIAVGVIGIGAAFALKGHVSSSPREIKTIMADAGPTKIQPPPDATADLAGAQDSTLLGKSNQPAPTSLVNREEQPVDLTQAVQDNAMRAAQMNPGTMPANVTDASTVPVPPSPRQVQTAMADPQGSGRVDAIGNQMQAFGMSDMPAPKRVKVVSVRPDGTILPNDQPPAAAIPAPRQAATRTSERSGPVAKASTPKTAKSTARVVSTTPKSIEAIAAGDDGVEAKPAKKGRPQRVASAETGNEAATETSAATGGGFAVQLAAPGSEADAKAAASRFAKKFADALGGRHLGFHKAESNGKSVYRVRVSSLSRADAVSLCEKLKADGGSCFIAKN